MTDWKKVAAKYKAQHENDNRLIAYQGAKLIRLNTGKCTCTNRPGDEYYCPTHGGEGSWIDLRVKADMLVKALNEWIVIQNEGVKRSAGEALGSQLKELGQTLQKLQKYEY